MFYTFFWLLFWKVLIPILFIVMSLTEAHASVEYGGITAESHHQMEVYSLGEVIFPEYLGCTDETALFSISFLQKQGFERAAKKLFKKFIQQRICGTFPVTDDIILELQEKLMQVDGSYNDSVWIQYSNMKIFFFWPFILPSWFEGD